MEKLTIRDLLDTAEKEEILFTALEQYENRCRSNGSRKMAGYGSATELLKIESWIDRADAVRKLTGELATECS